MTRAQLLNGVSRYATLAHLYPEALHAPTATVEIDGVLVTMNLRRRKPEAGPDPAELRAMKRQIFHNLVAISAKQVPIQHVHPRTARVAKFKEMMADG